MLTAYSTPAWKQVDSGGAAGTYLAVSNNLSDVASPSTARTNLGLGTAATHADTDYEHAANKGAANGYAGLDGSGKVPTSQLPAAVTGGYNYQGTWNASTNTPTLTSGSGTKGYLYKVSVAGTTTLDGVSSWAVGDEVVFDGTAWDKIEGQNNVNAVNGRTGAVTLTGTDIPVFGASGTGHAAGAVPDPGSSAGTTRYLREDGTWQTPPGTATGYLTVANNLSDLASASTARTNLGLGTAATQNTGTAAGTVPLRGTGGSIPFVNGVVNVDDTGQKVLATGSSTLFVYTGTSGLQFTNQANTTAIGTLSNTGDLSVAGALRTNGSLVLTGVTLSMPTTFSVSGGGTGALSVTYANQSANTFLAGPASGAAGTPSFRAIAPADLPVFGASGASHAPGAVPDPGSTAGTTRYLREDGTWSTVAGATGGSVTSVALTMPSGFSVSGSPITGSGTLAVTESTQSANTVKAGPSSGAAAAPTYRALVASDLPTSGVGTGATVGSSTLIPVITYDTYGRITSISTASVSAGFANPMTTLGDTLYGGSGGSATRLAGNTTTTRKFLRQVGDGTNSAAAAWDTLLAGDLGSGTADSTKFLRGDQTWQTPPGAAAFAPSSSLPTPLSTNYGYGYVLAGAIDYDGTILAETGLVNFWKLNEAAGATSWADSKGSATLSLSSTGTTSPTSGATALTSDAESSVTFAGTGGKWLQTASSPVLTAGPLAVEFWWKKTSTAESDLFGLGTSSGAFGVLHASNQCIYIDVNGTAIQVSATTLAINTAHHLVVSYSSGTFTVYADGSLLGTVTATMGTVTGPTTVGNFLATNNVTTGSISKVAVYNTTLSSSQASAHYAKGSGTAVNDKVYVSVKKSDGTYVMDQAFTVNNPPTSAQVTPTFNNAGNSGTTLTVNWATANAQKVTLTGNATFAFSNPTAGGVYVLELVQDATGSRTAVFPASVKWSGGTAPTLTTTASKTDIFTFFYDGTSYFGVTSGLNF